MTPQLDLFGEVKVKEPLQVSRWNTKLGVLPSFSLPVLKTCPGKTEFCSRLCYGLNGRFARQRVREIYQSNLEVSKQADFVERIVRELLKTKPEAFRLHVVGDFYSVEYVEKWLEIADRVPDIKFFGSTRSWRVPGLRDAVTRLRDLPNVYLRASIDFSHLDKPSCSWGVWSIEGEGDPCPHDYGLIENCITCKKCWQNKDSDIRLRIKWGVPTQLSSPMI
ncbi:MAG: hypothetical protein KAW00_03385 [Dehalococcoidia bacterium]|nr:hypothetical protein [Dehalococcoidia bacterium]